LSDSKRLLLSLFGNPETTPGGLALKFYSSVRIRLQPRAKIKSKDKIIGVRVEAKIVKNKVAPPFKTAEFDIYYNEGISYIADLVNVGIKYDVIKKSGSWLEYEKQKLGQGMEAVKQFLRKNPKLVEKIRKDVLEKVKEEQKKEEEL